MSTLAETTINILFTFVYTFIKILLAPLDYIILGYLPDVNGMIENIKNFLSLCLSSVGWVLDILAIPGGVITLIASYFLLKYTIHMAMILFKIIFSWIRGLK